MPVFRRRNRGASINLNPVGSGGNYIPFGMVCDLGFAMDAGQPDGYHITIPNDCPNRSKRLG